MSDRPLYPLHALAAAEASGEACAAPGCWEACVARVYDRERGALLCLDHLLSRLRKRPVGDSVRMIRVGERTGQPYRVSLDVATLHLDPDQVGALRAWEQYSGRWISLRPEQMAEVP